MSTDLAADSGDNESHLENLPLITEQDDTSSSSRVRCTRCAVTTGRWALTNLLLILTFISVLLGIILGVSIRQAEPGRVWVELISFPGEIFLRVLKMLILPLIIFSLLAGLGSLDTKLAGILGWRTVVYYLSTTGLAVVLGLALVMIIQPGARGAVKRECDNSTLSVTGHELETLDAILDLVR